MKNKSASRFVAILTRGFWVVVWGVFASALVLLALRAFAH